MIDPRQNLVKVSTN